MAAKKVVKKDEPLYINGRYVAKSSKPLHPVTTKKGSSPYKLTSKSVKVTLIKSTIGSLQEHIATIEALGLIKIGQSKIFQNNDAIEGMLYRVRHLVEVEEVKGGAK